MKSDLHTKGFAPLSVFIFFALAFGAALIGLAAIRALGAAGERTLFSVAPKYVLAEAADTIRGFFINDSGAPAALGTHGLAAVPPAEITHLGAAHGKNKNHNGAPARANAEVVGPALAAAAAPQPTGPSVAQAAPATTPPTAPTTSAATAASQADTHAARTASAHASVSSLVQPPHVAQCPYDTGQTPSHRDIILNELAWMGSAKSANDEWIELKNISSGALDMSGWQLVNKDGQLRVTFPPGTTLASGAFYLLERTDDASVPDVATDMIYSGALKNSGEGVRLFTDNCVLADEAIGNPWPAGDAATHHTMERGADLLWYTSSVTTGPIFGTPKAENSPRIPVVAAIVATHGSSDTTSPANTSAPAAQADSDTGAATHVVISEIQAGTAQGADDEFVELYNPTNAAVALSGWSLTKKTSNGKEDPLVATEHLDGKVIAPHGFLLLVNSGGYRGVVAPDVAWATSNTIAYVNNAAVLHDRTNQVDEVSWTTIDVGKSFERKAIQNGACVVATGNGEYLGNGCDTDAATDFDVRATPNPQNSGSLPEPRDGPTAAANFNGIYDQTTQRVVFGWEASYDARGSTTTVSYVVAFSDGAATTTLATTTATAYAYAVQSAGQTLSCALAAFDAEGLSGGAATTTVAIAGAQTVQADQGDIAYATASSTTATTTGASLSLAAVTSEATTTAPDASDATTVATTTTKMVSATSTAATSGLSPATHVVISEVRYGTTGDTSQEFIELYNPTVADLALAGWSIQKKSSSGVEGPLVAAAHVSGKIIAAHGYLLLVNETGYRGAVQADATWAASYSLVKNNGVALYDASGAQVDEVSWTELPDGASMEREAVQSGTCVSAAGAGELLGNGCDTDSSVDFETRESPNPQNSASPHEPHDNF